MKVACTLNSVQVATAVGPKVAVATVRVALEQEAEVDVVLGLEVAAVADWAVGGLVATVAEMGSEAEKVGIQEAVAKVARVVAQAVGTAAKAAAALWAQAVGHVAQWLVVGLEAVMAEVAMAVGVLVVEAVLEVAEGWGLVGGRVLPHREAVAVGTE